MINGLWLMDFVSRSDPTLDGFGKGAALRNGVNLLLVESETRFSGASSIMRILLRRRSRSVSFQCQQATPVPVNLLPQTETNFETVPNG
jgi:hypothetical protein